MKNIHKVILIFSVLFIPEVMYAFNLAESSAGGIIMELVGIADSLTPILSTLAFLVFFWGLSKFILNSNKPEEIKNGKSYMLWGILALFILLTYRTIIGLISVELGIGTQDPLIPQLPTNIQSTP
jgi:hypothetical protein